MQLYYCNQQKLEGEWSGNEASKKYVSESYAVEDVDGWGYNRAHMCTNFLGSHPVFIGATPTHYFAAGPKLTGYRNKQ